MAGGEEGLIDKQNHHNVAEITPYRCPDYGCFSCLIAAEQLKNITAVQYDFLYCPWSSVTD